MLILIDEKRAQRTAILYLETFKKLITRGEMIFLD